MLIKQYYQQAITEHGEESFFEICRISHEKPTNAVLAIPGVHYEEKYLEDWNKQRDCRNPLTNESGPTHFVIDDAYNELYKEYCTEKIRRFIKRFVERRQGVI